MTCRRAFELDVPAFVVDPRDPAWDDFRAHYPRCADCAAEVAAWTALQGSLAERHPEPEELLRWNDAPDALAADARATIARHVERCASCRDELRALGGVAAVHARDADAAAAGAGHAATHATRATEHAHHPSASRAGGRHAERHAFAREGSARGAAHAGAPAGGARGAGRRGPVARVLLHPAFAYAVLALVLLLPGVRAALDRDAGRAAFDAPATPPPGQAPAAPQSITASSGRVQAERDDAAEENVAGQPDDAHVDRTAPRLMRQAPFRPAPPPPPAAVPAPVAAPPQPAAAVAPAAKAAAPLEEGRLARGGQAAEAPVPAAAGAGAGAALSDAVSSADAARRERVPGSSASAPSAPIRLLPAAGGAARTLVVVLPPSATTAASVEIRVVDAGGGRELRQRIRRAPGAEPEVRMTLPAGFGAAVLQVEVYADGAGPLLQGSVTP
ncbi:MAG: hypothetical protein U0842_14480 [Candidatus Binatia bacterium]